MDFLCHSKYLPSFNSNPSYKQYTYCNKVLYFNSFRLNEIELKNNDRLLIIGDCINQDILKTSDSFSSTLLKQLKGIFTLFVLSNESISIYSSFFGLLPIYYTSDFTAVSSSPHLIADALNHNKKLNKRFVLESFLFNYSFSDQSLYKNILQLGAFQYISLKNDHGRIEETENISTWFTGNPLNGKKQLTKLAEIFVNESKYYFDPVKNSVNFTSGFDGRTLVACGLHHKADFETYSVGCKENDDVIIPQNNSKELNLPYHFYDLERDEYIDDYYKLAQQICRQTAGFNGFLYPHFLYGTLKESSRNNILLTGYCGSELFRALHIQGAVTSSELVNIFNKKDDKKLKELFLTSPKLSFLNLPDFKLEFEEIFENIIEFRRKAKYFHTINHFFYHYIFTEVFRKVYGSWTKAQFPYMIIRTPFLDFRFIHELIKTDLAGCNNDFFVHDPLKRMRGQLLYAEIIRQTNEKLFKIKTGKGYSPSDLTSLKGNIKLLFPYLKKKISGNISKTNLDNLSLVTGYSRHRSETEKILENLDGFKVTELRKASGNLNPYTSETERDMIFQAASLASITQN